MPEGNRAPDGAVGVTAFRVDRGCGEPDEMWPGPARTAEMRSSAAAAKLVALPPSSSEATERITACAPLPVMLAGSRRSRATSGSLITSTAGAQPRSRWIRWRDARQRRGAAVRKRCRGPRPPRSETDPSRQGIGRRSCGAFHQLLLTLTVRKLSRSTSEGSILTPKRCSRNPMRANTPSESMISSWRRSVSAVTGNEPSDNSAWTNRRISSLTSLMIARPRSQDTPQRHSRAGRRARRNADAIIGRRSQNLETGHYHRSRCPATVMSSSRHAVCATRGGTMPPQPPGEQQSR